LRVVVGGVNARRGSAGPFRPALRLWIVAVAALLAVALAPSALAAEKVGYPSSIASTGDSITRAFNLGTLPFTDAPSRSWATGTDSRVVSHYSRILAANPAISGHRFNDAASGARMRDLNGQAAAATTQNAEYVVVLMGANDVCRSSEAAMTSVADFRAQYRTALETLSAGLPDARIYVVSIPDVHRLWSVLRNNFVARLVWDAFDICQSMLARPLSTDQADVERRERVRQREIAFNQELAAGCAAYIHCRFDGNAVFNTAFAASDVSTRDYFHPSLSGQAKLAAISWSAGFDFTDASAPVSSATVSSGVVTLTAGDDVGVAGIEYRLGSGPYVRYSGPFAIASGTTVVFRAVDVNGNVEAAQELIP
jgi:lysophospholipase L1-like esterase